MKDKNVKEHGASAKRGGGRGKSRPAVRSSKERKGQISTFLEREKKQQLIIRKKRRRTTSICGSRGKMEEIRPREKKNAEAR